MEKFEFYFLELSRFSFIIIIIFFFRKNACSLIFFHFLKKFIEVQLIYKVMIISAVQQRDSIIHVHTSILSHILFPHRLSQNIFLQNKIRIFKHNYIQTDYYIVDLKKQIVSLWRSGMENMLRQIGNLFYTLSHFVWLSSLLFSIIYYISIFL